MVKMLKIKEDVFIKELNAQKKKEAALLKQLEKLEPAGQEGGQGAEQSWTLLMSKGWDSVKVRTLKKEKKKELTPEELEEKRK